MFFQVDDGGMILIPKNSGLTFQSIALKVAAEPCTLVAEGFPTTRLNSPAMVVVALCCSSQIYVPVPFKRNPALYQRG